MPATQNDHAPQGKASEGWMKRALPSKPGALEPARDFEILGES
ncbi:hypothetical protein N9P82_00075 [bacterium]|nr:hypothetical protein [bacterium]